VKTKTCTKCNNDFNLRDVDLSFYKTIDVPEPSLCPDCRRQRRLAWRNERKLYNRKCNATGQDIISNISPGKPYPVFDRKYWFSENHNPLKYGVDFDFSKNFMEQFAELQKTVPRFSIQQWEPMENSDYTNFISNSKNSYYLFDSDFCEDSLYCNVLKNSKDCVDCSFTSKSELCYETVNCNNCYNLKKSINCNTCSDSQYLFGCIGCNECTFCTNIRNKKYYFENKKYSKEEYYRKIEGLKLDEYTSAQSNDAKFKKIIEKSPKRFLNGTNNENVTGDYINNSKNAHECFNIEECYDVAYCDLIYRARDCYDISSFGENIELMYECTTAGINSQNCKFCFTSLINSSDLTYCDTACSCKNCFGCVGINHNKYCIFNKQYSKDEYEILRDKIILHMKETGEWGEFFPIEISPFAYNESIAQEFYPLTKEQVTASRWKWQDIKDITYNANDSIAAQDLPPTISETNDDILEKVILCEITKRPFKIQIMELAFYKNQNIPLPHFHPDIRHLMRMQNINSRNLYERKCSKCKKQLKTTYTEEKILCEKCYNELVD